MTDSPDEHAPNPIASALLRLFGNMLAVEADRTACAMVITGTPENWALTGTVTAALDYAARMALFVARAIDGREPDRAKWDAACDAAWKRANPVAEVVVATEETTT